MCNWIWVSGVFAPGEARRRVLLVENDGDITTTGYAGGTALGTSSVFKVKPTSPGGVWAANASDVFPWQATRDNTYHVIAAGSIEEELTYRECNQLCLRNDVDDVLAAHNW